MKWMSHLFKAFYVIIIIALGYKYNCYLQRQFYKYQLSSDKI